MVKDAARDGVGRMGVLGSASMPSSIRGGRWTSRAKSGFFGADSGAERLGSRFAGAEG
jgi:hypothetical protein